MSTLAGLGIAVAQQAEPPQEEVKDDRAWKPTAIERQAYRDIVDFNIFSADRSQLASQVDQQRNPVEPAKEPEPAKPVEVVVEQPPDPDASWIVTGITHDTEGSVVFIEHLETGELTRLTQPTAFSQGEVTSIGYDAILYTVQDEERMIQVGQTLIGKNATPTAATSGQASTPSSNTPSSGSAADRLQALRERRAREQGSAAPTPPPSQTPEPATPGNTDETPATPSAPSTQAAPSTSTTTLTSP